MQLGNALLMMTALATACKASTLPGLLSLSAYALLLGLETLAFFGYAPSVGAIILQDRLVPENPEFPGVLSPQSLILHALMLGILIIRHFSRQHSPSGQVQIVLASLAIALPVSSMLFRLLGFEYAFDFVEFTRFGLPTELSGILVLTLLVATANSGVAMRSGERIAIAFVSLAVGISVLTRLPALIGGLEASNETIFAGWLSIALLAILLIVALSFWGRYRKSLEQLASRNNRLERSIEEKKILISSLGQNVVPQLNQVAEAIATGGSRVVNPDDLRSAAIGVQGIQQAIKSILDYSSLTDPIQIERLNKPWRQMEISPVIQAAIDEVSKRFEVSIDCQIDAPNDSILCPEESLELIIEQLASNSVQYSAEPFQESLRIRAVVSVGELGISICIDDRGGGIPEEAWERVLLARVRNTAKGSGSGMGLAIVDTIARMQGGKVRFANLQDEEGYTFRVCVEIPIPNL